MYGRYTITAYVDATQEIICMHNLCCRKDGKGKMGRSKRISRKPVCIFYYLIVNYIQSLCSLEAKKK